MVKICPFVDKYKSAINAAYPDVEVVMGTDAVSDQHIEIMKAMFKKLLTDPNPDISEEYLKVRLSVE